MTVYDALIKYVPGRSAPDSYDPELGRPPPDFVVSRDIEGNALSHYGDMVWERSPYSSDEAIPFYFQFWEDGDTTPLRRTLADELRWIMFLLIWRHPARRVSSTKTLYSNLLALRNLARRADARGITIGEAAQDRVFMVATPGNQNRSILKIFGILQFLGVENSGFAIAPGILPFLSNAAGAYDDTMKQVAPIPTRTYSTILNSLSVEVSNLQPVIGRICAMYGMIKSGPGIGMTLQSQKKNGTREATFDNLLDQFGLTDFWPTTGGIASVFGLSNLVREIQTLISLKVQAYTGMRAAEVRYLPYDCLEEARRDGDSRIHYVVKGTTTKLNSGKEKKTQWITIQAAADAIRIAQQLAKAIYAADGIEPNQLNSRKMGSFLFPTANCDGKRRQLDSIGARPAGLKMTDRIYSILSPIINEEDQQELYAIDRHRPWATEDLYAVGSPWRLRTHQLRRSLALYAQSSGLVSLPTLKRQLQHLTVEMSLYYAKGSAFSQNFIGKKLQRAEKHFGDEWQETQPVSQYLAYVAAILLSDETDMFGGHGQWLKSRKRDAKGQITLNRAETMKSFKNGEMAYRPTPLGGCVNPVSCDKTPINVLSVECISTDCKNLIASTRKVERIIFVKSNTIKRLKATDPTSAEVRIEEAELNALQAGLARAKKLS